MQEGDVLLQAQAVLLHEQGVGHPHIPEVPGLLGDVGDRLLLPAVALNEAVLGGQTAEGPAGPFVGKVGADEVDAGGGLGQVHGQAGLVLTAPGEGHVLPGEGLPFFC